MKAASPDSTFDVAQKRLALHAGYRSALTCDQRACHRRLVKSGLLSEAKAIVDQAARFFLAAHQAVDRMNERELIAFERALALDDAIALHQVVAASLLRSERELLHLRIETPTVLLTAVAD